MAIKRIQKELLWNAKIPLKTYLLVNIVKNICAIGSHYDILNGSPFQGGVFLKIIRLTDLKLYPERIYHPNINSATISLDSGILWWLVSSVDFLQIAYNNKRSAITS